MIEQYKQRQKEHTELALCSLNLQETQSRCYNGKMVAGQSENKAGHMSKIKRKEN